MFTFSIAKEFVDGNKKKCRLSFLVTSLYNGSEFTAAVITELASMWPDLKIVHCKPRHHQSQGSVERANSDIKEMLVAWMADNISTDWTMGVKFVQFAKIPRITLESIEALMLQCLGPVPVRVGLTSTLLPSEVISRLETDWRPHRPKKRP